jgi:hypothetical protein
VAQAIETEVPFVIGPDDGMKTGSATCGKEYVAVAVLVPVYPLAIASALIVRGPGPVKAIGVV